MRDETTLLLFSSSIAESFERALHISRDLAHARQLRAPVALQESGVEWRIYLVSVDVQRLVPRIRIVFIDDGRIYDIEQELRAGTVCRLENYCISRNQPRPYEVYGIPGRRRRDRRIFGLRLIEQREGTTTAPSDEHHMLVAKHFLGVPDIRAQIEQYLFENAGGIVPCITAACTKDVRAAMRSFARDRKQLQGRSGMHVDLQRVARLVAWSNQNSFDVHRALVSSKAICFGECLALVIGEMKPFEFQFEALRHFGLSPHTLRQGQRETCPLTS